ncbi:AAA family ATPase [Bacillus sp. CRN 9]|nr:AAA family ATPase [Bacillus sp. CRN 9]
MMNQFDTDHRIVKWEKELSDQGFVNNEDDLLQMITSLDREDEPEKLSKLLMIAASSKANDASQETLALAWMEEALKLNPKNKEAERFISEKNWTTKQYSLNQLQFPPLRESDNRAAKKKTALAFIDITRGFLSDADELEQQLANQIKRCENTGSSSVIEKYRELYALLEEVIEEASALLKAAEEYEKSISGVFYTSTYLDDMKIHIEQIEKMKKQWESIFTSVEESPKEINPLVELENMVGLNDVKERIEEHYRFLQYQAERQNLGFKNKDDLSLHMVLTGNPGTGKTTLARLLAKIYHHLGVLPREEVVEVNRSHLIGAYMGQTEENIKTAIESALGGILFIDEAYSLKREGQSGNDYGQTAVDTLVSLMTSEEYSGKFAIILAGYPDEMRQFLAANPGLRSRFSSSNYFSLTDYTNEELIQIAEKIAKENDYILTKEAKIELNHRIDQEKVDTTFGNARTVKNIVMDAIFKKGAQAQSRHHFLSYTLLDKEDFTVNQSDNTIAAKAQLDKLIGLNNVKEEVNSLVSFAKMQKLRQEAGLPALPLQLHSVFTGNPGTGKTTVAKIYSQFLKECGMLKRGHLIVASRSDFVAGYVGQTAIKTKKLIRRALGGVLFIDEAYSLFSPMQADFGKEVIDTLTDEMTKHNENLVVILAGYPQEMEPLLNSNPGLKSRFKKFIHFPDYQSEQLIEILENYLKKYHYVLDTEAVTLLKEKLHEIDTKDNGRFATNLADKAVQMQARRIMDTANVNIAEEMSTLKRADFIHAIENTRNGE